MIDWSTKKAAIAAFVVASSGLASTSVVWTDEPMPSLECPYIELTISGERGIGSDDEDLETVTEDDVEYLVPRVVGTVEFTCSIRYRSRSSADAVSARTVLSKVRASLHHSTLRKTLEDAGVAFLDTLTLQTLSLVHDKRRESIAVLDVRMSTKSELSIDTARIDPVKSVEVSYQADERPAQTLTVTDEG